MKKYERWFYDIAMEAPLRVTQQWNKELEKSNTFWERPCGVYISNRGNNQNYIYINPRMPYSYKVIVLLHELGHHYCYKSKCKCNLKKNQHLVEPHAWRFTLKMLLASSCKELLRIAIKDIIKRSEHNDIDAKRVIKYSVFRKATKYAY